MDFKKLGLFAAGTLFGTAGIKILTSKDARKVYTEATAAALRVKECVMTTVTNVQEGAGDILADAKAINDQRAALLKWWRTHLLRPRPLLRNKQVSTEKPPRSGGFSFFCNVLLEAIP